MNTEIPVACRRHYGNTAFRNYCTTFELGPTRSRGVISNKNPLSHSASGGKDSEDHTFCCFELSPVGQDLLRFLAAMPGVEEVEVEGTPSMKPRYVLGEISLYVVDPEEWERLERNLVYGLSMLTGRDVVLEQFGGRADSRVENAFTWLLAFGTPHPAQLALR